MKNLGIIILMSVGLVGLSHLLWPPDYAAEDFISTFIGQVFGVNALPLIIGAIARVISRKKEAFFPAWAVAFCIFGVGLLFQLHHKNTEENAPKSVGSEGIDATILDSSPGVIEATTPESTISEEPDSVASIESVELSKVPEKPRMFVSKEYGFGIVFPNGYPQNIEGFGMQGDGVRHQFLDETGENPTLYSVTTIHGAEMYKGLDTIALLDATADMHLELEESKHLAHSKKFMKWGDRDVLFFDSFLKEDNYSYPKRSMLLLRESDGVLFTISVLSATRDQLDENLQNFASSLVLIRK